MKALNALKCGLSIHLTYPRDAAAKEIDKLRDIHERMCAVEDTIPD